MYNRFLFKNRPPKRRAVEKSSRQVTVRKAIKLKDEAKNGKKTYGCEVVHKFKEGHDKKTIKCTYSFTFHTRSVANF